MFQEGFGLWSLLCDERRLAEHGAGLTPVPVMATPLPEPPALDQLPASEEPVSEAFVASVATCVPAMPVMAEEVVLDVFDSFF